MALTEEQFDVWWKENGIESATFAEKSAARKGWKAAIAALPKPEPVAWRHTMDNTEGIETNEPWVVITGNENPPFGKPGIDYSEEYPVTSEPLYTESPIAQPASAPSEQKPAAHLSEIYEQMETPFNKLLSAQQRHFLFENEYELKYLPIYADQPDPTYIVKWVWEVRDKHGASVAEAHEWMYQAINNAQVDAIASVKGGA